MNTRVLTRSRNRRITSYPRTTGARGVIRVPVALVVLSDRPDNEGWGAPETYPLCAGCGIHWPGAPPRGGQLGREEGLARTRAGENPLFRAPTSQLGDPPRGRAPLAPQAKVSQRTDPGVGRPQADPENKGRGWLDGNPSAALLPGWPKPHRLNPMEGYIP